MLTIFETTGGSTSKLYTIKKVCFVFVFSKSKGISTFKEDVLFTVENRAMAPTN